MKTCINNIIGVLFPTTTWCSIQFYRRGEEMLGAQAEIFFFSKKVLINNQLFVTPYSHSSWPSSRRKCMHSLLSIFETCRKREMEREQ